MEQTVLTLTKTDIDRMDRNIEQLRNRMESTFDSINLVLREISTSLTAMSSICPIQKEAIEKLDARIDDIEERTEKLENVYHEAKGITTVAKVVYGIISAIIGFLASQIDKVF